jgi:hypothetical protein
MHVPIIIGGAFDIYFVTPRAPPLMTSTLSQIQFRRPKSHWNHKITIIRNVVSFYSHLKPLSNPEVDTLLRATHKKYELPIFVAITTPLIIKKA